jgi:thiol-disulfide isomerase/thioredoxin
MAYFKTRVGTGLLAAIAISSAATAADRLVIAEEFTATWCTYCPSVASALFSLQMDRPNDIVGLMIHCGDSYTTSWGNSRESFYSIGGYPTVYLDGWSGMEGSYGSVSANYSQLESRLNSCLARSTDVTIDLLGEEVSGSQYKISGELAIEAGGVGKTIRVQLLQCFNQTNWPESNEEQFNTLRQSAASFDVTLAAGQTHTWEHTFTLSGESLSAPSEVNYICIAQTPNGSGPANIFNSSVHGHGQLPPADVTVGPGQDYSSIQDALDAVGTGSTITVMPGTYVGLLDFSGRSADIVSSGGPDVTIIDGNSLGTAITMLDAEDSLIDGFTITGGYNSVGSAFKINGDPTITNCIIRDNVATSNYCVLSSGNPYLANNLFCSNSPNNVAVTWTDGGGNVFDDNCSGTEPCSGDANGDNAVDVNDVLTAISAFGSTDGSGDVNDDGVCNVNDILLIVSNFGSNC